MALTWVDWLLMAVYFGFVLGVGAALKRTTTTSAAFFQAGRAIPAWVCGLAFISANLGAQEIIGMAASGAKYGISTSHFYWIGAIPAMVFLGVFMMPFYYGSHARSVPEYLRLRFDEKTRAFNAFSFALMTVFSSGISMYAMAKLLQILHIFDAPFAALGLGPQYIFHVCIVSSAIVVLVYVLLGGLSSAIYNEVLQFFLIVAGFMPLVYLGLRDAGGWSGIAQTLPPTMTHAWRGFRRAPPPTRWASTRSAWRWGSASCSRSATGAPTFSSCSARWPPIRWPPRGGRRSSRHCRRCCFRFSSILPGLIALDRCRAG